MSVDKPKWKIVVQDDGINVVFEFFLTSKEARKLIHDLQDALFEFSPLEEKREK